MKTHKRVLFSLHIPPPLHGSSMVGFQIKHSDIINVTFDCRYVNLGTSKTMYEIGRNVLGKIKPYLSILWQVTTNLFTRRPDLYYLAIVAEGIGFYKDVVLVFLAKMFGVKLVYHLHNKGVKNKQDKFPYNLLYRFVFKNADVILLSALLYPDIKKYVSANAVHYCPNGIMDKSSRMAPLVTDNADTKMKRINRGNGVFEILFLSNLLVSKGLYDLIDACRILMEKGIVFHCTIIGGEGDISKKQLTSKIEAAGLILNVTYEGIKYGPEKEKAFEMADIFVLPSHNECMPLVIIEAMQYSLPVISTFEGGIPDLIEDGTTGFLIPEKDPGILAEKLIVMFNDPLIRQRMGNAGREKYEKDFTLDIFENRMKEILEKLTM